MVFGLHYQRGMGREVTFDRERRRAQRYSVRVPIDFDTGDGTTEDVSESGIRFVTSTPCSLGQVIQFVLRFIRLQAGEARWRISGTGRVVRIGWDGDRRIIAIAVEQYSFPTL